MSSVGTTAPPAANTIPTRAQRRRIRQSLGGRNELQLDEHLSNDRRGVRGRTRGQSQDEADEAFIEGAAMRTRIKVTVPGLAFAASGAVGAQQLQYLSG